MFVLLQLLCYSLPSSSAILIVTILMVNEIQKENLHNAYCLYRVYVMIVSYQLTVSPCKDCVLSRLFSSSVH